MVSETCWIPTPPLPFYGLLSVRCGVCGRRFYGRRGSRAARYELHWRVEHEPRTISERNAMPVKIGVSRERAFAIYAEVAYERAKLLRPGARLDS